MIIIDENREIQDFLDEKRFTLEGVVRLDQSTFELSNGLDTELILISICVWEKLDEFTRSKAEKSPALFLFEDKKFDYDKFKLPNNCAGVLSLNENSLALFEKQLKIIRNFSIQQSVLRSQFLTLNRELNSILGETEIELLRVKKAYESLAPKRLENIKGVEIYSKYIAGESLGGEFFDIYNLKNKIVFMLSATSSYVLSSSILQYYNELKSKKVAKLDAFQELFNRVNSERIAISEGKQKDVELDFLMGELDLTTLEVHGVSFGNFQLLSSNVKNNLNIIKRENSEKFSLKLDIGERILLNSTGFIKNWSTIAPEFIIEELLVNKKIKTIDVIDEIFFQLKKDSTSGFLPIDASSIILEVKKNVLLKA